MSEKERPELPEREPTSRPFDRNRIHEQAVVVRQLRELGGVPLPRVKRNAAGFAVEDE